MAVICRGGAHIASDDQRGLAIRCGDVEALYRGQCSGAIGVERGHTVTAGEGRTVWAIL